MILDKIAASTKIRVENLKKEVSFSFVKSEASKLVNKSPFAFEKAVKDGELTFICEIKKASPSKGLISENFPYIDIAKDYEAAGAGAISVLTEPEFFLGSDQYLKDVKKTVSIPVLRKDFTIDPYQIYEAALIGADCVLLICALLDTDTLKEYIKIADGLGLSCLVEAHDENEVKSAIEAGSRIVGVNNRNLKTFEVDITNSIRLRELVPSDISFVSESGIRTAQDISALRRIGASAVLIGETLMRSGDTGAELAKLRGSA
ncbi:indole-3-glycerol phosphate synthase TrpC [Ruminiclostridium cellulolyticum]|uniref:Indole-3-glycerol phosphate synthase n=1 Tax=Ruminiclostridium cellulolyticum (strain ATCC 35319 / DSM 5812 / JCM 6584 / H10) TaxID=394503 RepID=TRPC_RUMCH|nr:indole-3-glycerol phosphate synthase TrpC [Ruminiclostridium cellulolyticum]B8I0V0.1 RecName: Full=Indole-3-glycerol phosphate synthase; Short=IGPS [Ruminiclostridium cellulolyticum H10]ACL77506.1 Indole-3-glycerol phosphate synthase [Ruminiclostridium cellulolyticum H10]